MIRVNSLNKSYGAKNKVLRDVSFELPDTGFVCIVGPSGCGKTTLLNAIGGLDTFDKGTISTDKVKRFRCGTARSENYRNKNYGYIFQNYYLLPDHSVAYNVYLGLHAMNLSHREKLRRVREALTEVDMIRYARRLAGELSGGQQQRVAIARALARRPRVIFADEPTGNLDQANTVNICTLLRKISSHSLVIMVTHEDNIARFFADRILTIEEGRVTGDMTEWTRDGLSVDGNTFYAGDYEETKMEEEGVSLRLLRQEGAPEVKITVLALKDRVVIKLDDGRNITCAKGDELPEIREGTRPILRLESIDRPDEDVSVNTTRGRAGRGLRLSMMAKEARRLSQGKGAKRVGVKFFLTVLTLLTLLTFADYQYVSHLDPEDFVTTHSQLLEVQLRRGPALGEEYFGVNEIVGKYVDYLEQSGLKFTALPVVNLKAEVRLGMFRQFGSVKEHLEEFSYVPLSYLDESTLIYGRMPTNADEVVVDRWVLDNLLSQEGMVQTGVGNCNYFLGKEISYNRKNYSPTIVGISDSGEPAIYMDLAGISSICAGGTEVMALSDFRELFPELAEGITLGKNECIVITNNAGVGYVGGIGNIFETNDWQEYRIAATVTADTYATMVIRDEDMAERVRTQLSEFLFLICEDKDAMKDFLSTDPGRTLGNQVMLELRDLYDDAWERKAGDTEVRLDARTIVTVTVLLVCFVMLYLFQRSQVRERIGMVAVYRLLGIPGGKLTTIFCMESVLVFLRTTLPVTAFVWAVLAILNQIDALEIPLYLTAKAAGIGAGAILLFHILVSVIPLFRLLRQPPARLATKFDF